MLKEVSIPLGRKKYSTSNNSFRYMLCLTLIIVVVALILILLVGFSIYACHTNIQAELLKKENEKKEVKGSRTTIEKQISHVEHLDNALRRVAEEYLFKKLHNHRYWEMRQQSARETISSILPLFKERSLEPPDRHRYNASIFSPVLFANDELKTPNSPDTLSTQDEPI